MTLNIARYAKLIAKANDIDYVVSGAKGGLTIVTAEQWKAQKWDRQPDQWKKAKQEFLDCLDKEWGKGSYQLLPHRPPDGKPLEVREVRWMVEHDAARKRRPTASPQSAAEEHAQVLPNATSHVPLDSEAQAGAARQASGQTLADFQKLASADGELYIARDDINGGFKLERESDWQRHRDSWRRRASNEARGLFVEGLKTEYPHISYAIEKEIAPHLQQNGKPLKAWHIQVVLDRVEALQTKVMADLDNIVEFWEPDDPEMRQVALEVDALLGALPNENFDSSAFPTTEGAGNDQQVADLLAEFDKSVDFGSRIRLPQRTVQESLDEFQASPPRLDETEPEQATFIRTPSQPQANPVHEAASPIAPAPPAESPEAPMNRGLRPGLNRGPLPSEHKPTFGRQGSKPDLEAANVIQGTAWRELSQLFNGIESMSPRCRTRRRSRCSARERRRAQRKRRERRTNSGSSVAKGRLPTSS